MPKKNSEATSWIVTHDRRPDLMEGASTTGLLLLVIPSPRDLGVTSMMMNNSVNLYVS